MNKFSVVSVDMFGTLANARSVQYRVWQSLLKDRYSNELAEQYGWRTAVLFREYQNSVIQQNRYVPPKVIYENCFSTLFPQIDLDLDPKDAARIFAQHYPLSEPFDDTMPFLDAVGKAYPICLSSDTDEDMLGQLRQLYPFDSVFTSEKLGVYKTGSEGKFFLAVIDYYGVEPGRIIHIGDSLSDIIGASEAGIITCWLNRGGLEWAHDVKPDYEVSSLIETASILGIEIDSG
ncbi:HAD family hydrolase [Chloroflexota bacterium]